MVKKIPPPIKGEGLLIFIGALRNNPGFYIPAPRLHVYLAVTALRPFCG
jgi:hypothetical protein